MVIGTDRTVCCSKISAMHKICCKFNVCLKKPKLRARETCVLLKCFLVRSPQEVITLCKCVMQGSVSARPHVFIPSSQFGAKKNRRDCK